jgi:medium-chain acyl-[acyl-carrier-protein] hydrolase
MQRNLDTEPAPALYPSPNSATGSWFPERVADGPVRLLAIPYAGGGASLYRGWAARMPSVAVVPVQLPGRESRITETPFTRIEPLVASLADAVDGMLDAPYVLFGHSMGARIAFELARELRRRGQPDPLALVVSGCKAPHIARVPNPSVASLPEHLFVQMLRRMKGTPPEVFDDPELLAALLPALRADFMLIDQYDYQDERALTCPIRVFGGTEDSDARESDLLAWQSHTMSSFRLRLLPGGHFVVRTRQREMTTAITEDLAALLVERVS